MTGRPLEVGVVGCGEVAQRVHLPLLAARADVALAAVTDSNPHVLSGVARRFPRVRTFTSLDQMLGETQLDAVVVALPTAAHAATAQQLFEAGIHVYLEKPLATTLDEARTVVHAWQRSGAIGVMGFNCRANPLNVRMRELIRSGRAGSVVYLRTSFSVAPRPQPQWKQQRATGGGVLLDLGVHHIDLIRFLMDSEIESVRASVSSLRSEQDTALLELELSNGVRAHCFFSLCGAEGDHVEVHGDAARLAVSRFTSVDVAVVDNPGRGAGAVKQLLQRAAIIGQLPRAIRARRAPWREPGYEILLSRFVRAAASGQRPEDVPDITDGYACAAVVAAAERSLITGAFEKVPYAMSEQLLHGVT